MSELRKIIVAATSEMLDEPGEHGIYKTTRFYDRLEKELTEYMNGPRIVPDPCFELLLETVKNAAILPVSLMETVAQYVSYQGTPKMVIKPTEVKL